MSEIAKMPRPVARSARWLIVASFALGSVGGFLAATHWWSEAVETLNERVSRFQNTLQVVTPEQANKQFTALRSSLQATNRRLIEVEATGSIQQRQLPAWLRAAYSEIGQAAIRGSYENPRITDYFRAVVNSSQLRDDSSDWASAFVEWSLNSAGIKGPKSLWPLAWKNWGREISQPEPGCIVIFQFPSIQHVAFFIEDDGDFIKVLGGDQDDSVNISRYPKSAVVAYRMPPTLENSAKH